MEGLCKIAFDFMNEKKEKNEETQVTGGLVATATGNKVMSDIASNHLIQELQQGRQNLGSHNIKAMGALGIGSAAYGYGWNQINEARSN